MTAASIHFVVLALIFKNLSRKPFSEGGSPEGLVQKEERRVTPEFWVEL